MVRFRSPTSMLDSRHAGALMRNRFWPATGKSPSDAHTNHDESPPESSLPGRPPRPVPNWFCTMACTTSAVRSGRPA